MRRLLVLALVGAVVAGVGAARPQAELAWSSQLAARTPLLGFVHGFPSSTLVRVDPATLRVLPGKRLGVGNHTFAWSFSPDRSRLALGGERNNRAVPELLLVDAPRLRKLGRVQIAPKGELRGTRWLPGGRVLAVADGWGSGTIVAIVDAVRAQVVARRTLVGTPLHLAQTGDGIAILLAATETIGPARLAVVRSSGEIDVVSLRRVPAGTKPTGSATGAEFQLAHPGLAVDALGGRAFVVGAGDELAEVDLASLSVTYRRSSRPRSLLARLGAWLEPDAQAKGSLDGSRRFARWLGGGLLAVSGGDYTVSGTRSAPTFRGAGVRVIDTRTWSARSLAPGADSFRFAGGLVLGIGETWSSELRTSTPIGLSAYGLDGRKRFQLYRGTRVWLAHANERHAYVDRPGPGGVDVVELGSGRVIETRRSVPVPLSGTVWERG